MRFLEPFVCACVLSSVASASTTWFVDVHGVGPGTGTPADPYTSIQYAIERPTTVTGDTVLVAPGTYIGSVDFVGKNLRVASSNGADTTIIDAAGAWHAVSFQNNESAAAVLDGFSIRNGVAPGAPNGYGGGIYVGHASPSLMNLVIENNVARNGGGIALILSSSQLTNCKVRNNSTPPGDSSGRGLGLFVEFNSAPIVTACEFTDNHPSTPPSSPSSFVDGGGMYGRGTFVGCLFARNTAKRGAGAFTTTETGVNFSFCTIEENGICDGTFVCGEGGGIDSSYYHGAHLSDCVIRHNLGGGAWTAVLVRCRIEDNTSGPAPVVYGAGAYVCDLTDCVIARNRALSTPGGIADGGGAYGEHLTRCIIFGNVANRGAGVNAAYTESCTIFGNVATNTAGGILNDSTSFTTRNSIVWGNHPNQIVDTASPVSYCDVQGGWPGVGNIDADPRFFAPQSNDFHLKPSSPCIDAGFPSDPHDADGSIIDMGAVPFDPAYCSTPGAWCFGKVNSQGCTPAIGYAGTPSASGADDFFVTGANFVNQKSGLLFWGRASAFVPFQGGSLCVAGPFTRTPIQNSNGSPLPPPDCSGAYSFHFSQSYRASVGIAALDTIYAQWYSRDPAIADGTGVSLSNAIEFTICP